MEVGSDQDCIPIRARSKANSGWLLMARPCHPTTTILLYSNKMKFAAFVTPLFAAAALVASGRGTAAAAAANKNHATRRPK